MGERGLALTRLVLVPRQGQLQFVAAHVKALQAAGRSVLVVSAQDPAKYLLQRLRELGVDEARMFIIDAIGSPLGTERLDPERAHLVPNPTLLELIAKRSQQIIRSKAERPPAVVIHTVEAFALHNPATMLEQAVRYAVHNLARPHAVIDFLADPDADVSQAVVKFLRSFVDATVPAGTPPPAAH